MSDIGERVSAWMDEPAHVCVWEEHDCPIDGWVWLCVCGKTQVEDPSMSD